MVVVMAKGRMKPKYKRRSFSRQDGLQAKEYHQHIMEYNVVRTTTFELGQDQVLQLRHKQRFLDSFICGMTIEIQGREELTWSSLQPYQAWH